MEECVEELNCSQKTMLKLFSDLSDDFRATIETIKVKMVEIKIQVKLTMRAMGNQTPNQVCNVSSRLKIPEPKAFSRNRDGKELENFIIDIKQYFKASGINSEETKVTLAFMYLSDDAKL
ncbi:uncharacterized protein E5676_scaffold121G001100 [Cucumis melo var. makuwa]|uniref:Uncharacterized protein n=1 Tax=Cucumis melo var. makuwa TaxID=1194695 RepID=A0A5D3BUS6_CUCMM|nr:uncharacterized protein E5676_scaffold121G001100 [Cucumis melo var. makuwa]